MIPRERLLNLFNGELLDRTPTFSAGCSQTATVDCMEAIQIYWPDAHREPEKMAKLAASLYRLTGIEVAAVPFCMTVEAEALGCELKWSNKIDATPMISKSPYQSPNEVTLSNTFLNTKRIPVVIRAVEILKEDIGDTLPIVAGLTGPFTLASHLCGAENLLQWIILDPVKVHGFMKVATKVGIIFGKALRTAGADVISIADPSASGSALSKEMFSDFVKPSLKRMVKEIGGYTMLHICGDAMPILDEMVDIGVTAISIDETVDVAKAKTVTDKKTLLVGNVSASRTLLLGDPDRVKNESIEALKKGVDVLAPGCGIPPRTSNSNLKALVEAVLEFSDKSVTL